MAGKSLSSRALRADWVGKTPLRSGTMVIGFTGSMSSLTGWKRPRPNCARGRCARTTGRATLRRGCVEAVAVCTDRLGGLDVLINCATVMRMENFTDVTEEAWNRILAVNLSGPFFLIQAVLPHLIAGTWHVSTAPRRTDFGDGLSGPYSATRAALINLTKTLAIKYAEAPVRGNAVCPGPMPTKIAAYVRPPSTIKRDEIVRYSGLRALSDAAVVAKVVAFRFGRGIGHSRRGLDGRSRCVRRLNRTLETFGEKRT